MTDDARTRARRRARVAEVFGEALPDPDRSSGQEDAEGVITDAGRGRSREQELRREVPPHHTP